MFPRSVAGSVSLLLLGLESHHGDLGFGESSIERISTMHRCREGSGSSTLAGG
jgi:hypothetical protein